ncbi:MAG: acyltransferase family protein [Ruminococcus sp.]
MTGGTPRNRQTVRNSNIELFRIITMILIVSHHYVVNSGLMEVMSAEVLSAKSVFLYLFGAWGKIGINCFVLITGYFMCKSHITAKKFAKLVLEVVFYKVTIYCVFVFCGVSEFSFIQLMKAFLPVTQIADNFTGCYIVFFLFIPFLNILLKNISEKQHFLLICLLLFTYVFMGTLPFFSVTMNYVSWFIVLYFISSYVRLYSHKIFNNTLFWLFAMIASILLSVISVLLCLWTGHYVYRLVTDSNALIAVLTGFCSFMFFKNLNIKNSKIINWIASSTFGVLLIHANSDTMRQWLWKDTLNNIGNYYSSFVFVHAIVSVLSIFIICVLIDKLRIYFIERPVFRLWDKYYDRIKNVLIAFGNKVGSFLNFSD